MSKGRTEVPVGAAALKEVSYTTPGAARKLHFVLRNLILQTAVTAYT